ncbi:hypothetical protein BGW37DRAFT_493818 [Umbelopsis sp. PMI_123]|nr:hypothetical protein BGW37DRAFT_493818 [Umbelopsis sp. PMI_123]
MASDRISSVSSSHRTKAAEKWFKNATSDAKHNTVDKELQRIKNLGVVSVRKRYEDTSSPSPTSSFKDSFFGNASDLLKKKRRESNMNPAPAKASVEDVMDMINIPSQEPVAAVPSPEREVEKMIELESAVGENTKFPEARSSLQVSAVETTYENSASQRFDDISNDVTEQMTTDKDEVKLNSNDSKSVTEESLDDKLSESVEPVISATQDLQRFMDGTVLQDDAITDVAAGTRPSDQSNSRHSSEQEHKSSPMTLPISKHSSNKSTGSIDYSQADSASSLTVKTLISEAAHSSPASSFQLTATTSLPVPGGSPSTVISEMYNLVDQAKKASPAQGELTEIHEKLLGLVNALNVWHAVNQTNSTTHESSSEVEELRRQVKALEHKCELQQVDLHERAAWQSKLMQDKDSLLRKLSEINADGDQVPSDGWQTKSSPVHTASKILNRHSTGSNISSASFLMNHRSASRAGSRRLNPRPETPLPPQLPPPKDPLPPIPQERQSVHRQSILKDHHDKVVKELLDKLQAQQAKSKTIIDTLETKLSQMTIKSSELEKSVRHLQSELQAKVQTPSRSPAPPAAQPHSSKKKQSNRRSFNLLTLFGKR